MIRLENPVLNRELNVRTRVARIIPAVSIRGVILTLLFLLVLLSRLGRGLLAFVLAETFLILLLTPGAVCDAFASTAGQRDLRELAMTRLRSGTILLGKLAGANFYTFTIILFSGLIMSIVSLFYKDLHLWPLVRANIALLTILFASSVVSLAFSTLFRRNILASAILTYVFILLLIGSVIIPGPIMSRIHNSSAKTAIIKAALHANPVIMASRALGRVDIMRTRYMYNLADPIVGRGFVYPNWYYTGAIYFVVSCLLLVPVYIRFRRAALERD